MAEVQMRSDEDSDNRTKVRLVSEEPRREKDPTTMKTGLSGDSQGGDAAEECTKIVSCAEIPLDQLTRRRVADSTTMNGTTNGSHVPETVTSTILTEGRRADVNAAQSDGQSCDMSRPVDRSTSDQLLGNGNKVDEASANSNSDSTEPRSSSSHPEGSGSVGEGNAEAPSCKGGPVTTESTPSVKSNDVYFLSHLGLRKIKSLVNTSSVKTKPAVVDESSKIGPRDKDSQGTAGGEDAHKDLSASSSPPEKAVVTPEQSVNTPAEAGAKKPFVKTLKLVRHAADGSVVTEGDGATRNKDSQAVMSALMNDQGDTSKGMPLCIKIKLQEKNVTIICCPVALLLQHKERVDVSLRSGSEKELSITCRLCSHELSDPLAMLQHLKAEHQVTGCLQKLLNLNTRHLGCMIRPTCVSIPGVLAMPEGLSDMEQGVIRLSSLGIPRLSFMCRLCPLNFHSARGLNAHHHYYSMKSMNKDQPSTINGNWTCKLCPLQFSNFLDYYAHHRWMRIPKDLFVNTDPTVKKKRFEVMNEFGKVVASVEVPGTHSVAITPGLTENSDAVDMGWGPKGLGHSIGDLGHAKVFLNDASDSNQSADSSSVTSETAQHPDKTNQQQPEADKGKTTVPPLFQTLDTLCRKMVQKGEISMTSLEKSLASEGQEGEDHEYMCAMCHKTFPRLAQMQGHMGSHVRKHRSPKYPTTSLVGAVVTPGDPPPVAEAKPPPGVEPQDVEYQCGVCSETFPRLDQMQIHMEQHNRLHPATKTNMKSLATAFSETVVLMSLTCDICHWSFSSEHKLWAHRKTHTKHAEGEGSDINSGSAGTKVQKKKVFLCIHCKKTFTREVNLRFHLKMHISGKTCSEKNPSSGQVEADEELNDTAEDASPGNSTTSNEHVCQTCSRVFETAKQLRSHKVWHNKVRREQEPSDDNSSEEDWTPPFSIRKAKGNSPARRRRTLAFRACKKRRAKEDSGRESPKTVKLHCRICNSYFRRSSQHAKHMALHSRLDRGMGRRALRKSPRRGRYFQSRRSPQKKQRGGTSTSSSPTEMDGESPQGSPESTSKITNESAAATSPDDPSPGMAGDEAERSVESGSPKTYASNNVEKPTCSQAVEMADKSQSAKAATLEETGFSKEHPLSISSAGPKCEGNTAEVMDEETRANSSNGKSPEATANLQKVKEELSDMETSAEADNSSGETTDSADEKTILVESDAEPVEEASQEDLTEYAEEPMQVCGETEQCTGAVKDGGSNQKPERVGTDAQSSTICETERDDSQADGAAAEEDLDEDEMPIYLTIDEGTGTMVVDTSQKMQQTQSSVLSLMADGEGTETEGKPTQKPSTVQLTSPSKGAGKNLHVLMEDLSQAQVTSDVQFTDTQEVQSLVSSSPHKAVFVPLTPDDSASLIEGASLEAEPTSGSLDASKTAEPQSEPTVESAASHEDLKEVKALENQSLDANPQSPSAQATNTSEASGDCTDQSAVCNGVSNEIEAESCSKETTSSQKISDDAVQSTAPDDAQNDKAATQKSIDSEIISSQRDSSDSNTVMPNASKEASGQDSGPESSQKSEVSPVSENEVEISEGLQSKIEVSEAETKADGKETQSRCVANEHGATSKGKGTTKETRRGSLASKLGGNLLNGIGLTQIIEKLRQKLGNKTAATQHVEPDGSSTNAEDTETETKGTPSEVRTSCSEEDSTAEDPPSKQSPDRQLPSAPRRNQPRILEALKAGCREASPSLSKKDAGENAYKCSQCERCFSNINQLNAHMRVHMCTYAQTAEQTTRSSAAAARPKPAGQSLHKCDLCLKTFKDYKKLCGHLGAHVSHKKTSFKTGTDKDDGTESEESESAKGPPTMNSSRRRCEYNCKYCDMSFHRLVQFRSHVMAAHPTAKGKLFLLRPFACELCGKSFTKARQRQIHMRLHARTKRRQKLKKKSVLQLESDHTYFKKPPPDAKKATACEIVPALPQNLLADCSDPKKEDCLLEVHSCHLCGKSFPDRDKLAKHRAKHKRYACQFCSATFTLSQQLCGHMKVHGGRKGNNISKSPPSVECEANDSPKVPESKQVGEGSGPVAQCRARSPSRRLLEKVIKLYLFGSRRRKKQLAKGKTEWAKWLKPKHSLQRALMKGKQARMQKIYAVLRKSIILEIDADTHRLVYECKDCKRCSLSHRAVLNHFLNEHLLKEEKEAEMQPLAAFNPNKEAPEGEASSQRFRNKSKIGCPICKGSSGFQCHLHNEDGLMYIDSLLDSAKDGGVDVFDCKTCRERFPTAKDLAQHQQTHAGKSPLSLSGDLFSCTLCSFKSQTLHGLNSHQKAHREKAEGEVAAAPAPAPAAKVSNSDKSLRCPVCSFKVKNTYALAAHSRIHKGNRTKKRPLPTDEAPLAESQKETPVPQPTAQPSPKSTAEVEPEPTPQPSPASGSSPGFKQRKNSYNCPECPRYFYSMSAYQKHKKQHTEVRQFKCNLCIQTFDTSEAMETHITTIHRAQKWYRCTECSYSSFSLQLLQKHIKIHPKGSGKDDQPKVLKYLYVKQPGEKSKPGPKHNKANWSDYLSKVIRARVPKEEAQDSNQPQEEEILTSVSLPVETVEATTPEKVEKSGSESKRKATPSQTTPSPKRVRASKAEDDILKEGATRQQASGGRPKSDSPDEYYACSQCKDFQASSKAEWDSHMAQVHQASPGYKLKCPMCQYTTSKQERLTQHKRLHNVQTLQCNACPYRTPQNHLMIRHIQTVHRQHRPFKCKLCTYCTSYRHHLRRHTEKHKNPNFRCRYRKLMKKGDWHSAETPNSRIICEECGRELLNKKTLRNHYIKVHGYGRKLKTTTDAPDAKQAKGGKQLSFSRVPQDSDTGSEENLYECSVCSFKFKRRSDLNHHMSQGHSETKASLPCQCPQCGLVTGSGQLQAHMETHKEENLLSCEEEGCDFKTAEPVHLQRHLGKHTAKKDALISCRFCQLKFADATGLRLHNIHYHSDLTQVGINAKAPFMCTQCPFISSNEKDASRHFRLHNYNLPFKCEYCVFSSSTASAIATHQKIHRNPRRNQGSTLVSKKPSQRQKMHSGAPNKVPNGSSVVEVVQARASPKHVFVSKGKKLYECRYCQRCFDVAESWQRHELRHMAEWPQY